MSGKDLGNETEPQQTSQSHVVSIARVAYALAASTGFPMVEITDALTTALDRAEHVGLYDCDTDALAYLTDFSYSPNARSSLVYGLCDSPWWGDPDPVEWVQERQREYRDKFSHTGISRSAAREVCEAVLRIIGEGTGRTVDVAGLVDSMPSVRDDKRAGFAAKLPEALAASENQRPASAGAGSAPAYMDPTHPRYAPKLAAAVSAWEALEGVPLIRKTPKQLLTVWLRANASRFGLQDEEGGTNAQGIDEVAKVANWQTKGGAPKAAD